MFVHQFWLFKQIVLYELHHSFYMTSLTSIFPQLVSFWWTSKFTSFIALLNMLPFHAANFSIFLFCSDVHIFGLSQQILLFFYQFLTIFQHDSSIFWSSPEKLRKAKNRGGRHQEVVTVSETTVAQNRSGVVHLVESGI